MKDHSHTAHLSLQEANNVGNFLFLLMEPPKVFVTGHCLLAANVEQEQFWWSIFLKNVMDWYFFFTAVSKSIVLRQNKNLAL